MSRPSNVEILVEALPRGGVVVRVQGELDLACVDDLEAALASEKRDLVVDLTECTFLDSSAIRTLLEAAAEVESAGGRIAVVVSEPGVRRTLEIAGLNERIAIHASLDGALG